MSKDMPSRGRHDWEWRRRIRANPHAHLVYRVVVGFLGLATLVIGLILVPFPGPGWFIVLLGLGILASEFRWARDALQHSRQTLMAWNKWLRPQPWWVKALVLLLTVAAVGAVFWVLLLIGGVPPFLPDTVEEWVKQVPGLAH